MRRILNVFICLSLICAFAHAADWPQFRGAKGDAISSETGINKDWKTRPPKELWRVEMHDKGYAGAAVVGGKVFLLDPNGAEDTVRALDAASGKELWSFKYASAYTSMIGGGDPDWGFGRSTPTVDEGHIYTLSALGLLHCIDAEKGTKIWSRDIKADFKGKPGDWHYVAPPIVDGNKLIVCPGGETAVVALDKLSGKDIWKGGGSDKAGYALPIIATLDGKKQYVVLLGTSVVGVDAESGAALWTVPWKTDYDVNASAPVIVDANTVFICSGEKHGCTLIEVKGGAAKQLWQNKEMQSQFNGPVLANGHVYGIGDPGVLTCIELKTGNVAWKQKGFGKGGVMSVDGVLIAVDGNEGNVVMVALDPAAYKELGRIQPLEGRHWSPPLLANGKLYIRNRQTRVCLDAK